MRRGYIHDTIHHLQFLSQALAAGEASLFVHYVAWVRMLRRQRNLSTEILIVTLQCVATVLQRHVSSRGGSPWLPYIDAGLARLNQPAASEPDLVDSHPLSQLKKMYLDVVLRGKRRDASKLIMAALDAGADVRDIYLHVFQGAQYDIGQLWYMNEITTAQEHYCTAVTQSIISQLYPRIFSAQRNGRALVATCAFGERHEIGVRMVSDFFEMDGWDTYYLGTNTSAKRVVRELADRKAELLLVSVTMASHLAMAKRLITLVRSSNVCRGVMILVGGYPFNIATDLWKNIGADGCGRDAAEAVAVARTLLEKKSIAAGKL